MQICDVITQVVFFGVGVHLPGSLPAQEWTLSLSFSVQRFACSPREGGRRACVQTPTADSSLSLSTTSTRCWRSTPWCDAPLKLSPLTDWTASVSPAYTCLWSRLTARHWALSSRFSPCLPSTFIKASCLPSCDAWPVCFFFSFILLTFHCIVYDNIT